MKLLLLFHRLPYPPNKGEKIRYYHFLRGLAARHEVVTGSIAEATDSADDINLVARLSKQSKTVVMRGFDRRLAFARALATGKALSLAPFESAELQAWVDETLARGDIDCVLACSAAMGGFVEKARVPARRFVMDFVDMDSDKWDQYAHTARWPLSQLYRREARLTLAAEAAIAERADASLFVSGTEVDDFVQRVPQAGGKVHAVENGVDAEYYDPDRDYSMPFSAEQPAPLAFVGTMDYLPNIDAVTWFARSIMPLIRALKPQATFHIVGARPTAEVTRLASLPGVFVTGAVPDVRPYVAWARVSVAPLRLARGIQNKVLEAMAMARPVVVTPAALAGIDATPGREVLLANTEQEMANRVLQALDDPSAQDVGRAARRFVLARFAWSAKIARLEHFLRPADSHPDSAAAPGG
jgi:sugar transferase (PEP-CTERM/EpsH1 system associated)